MLALAFVGFIVYAALEPVAVLGVSGTGLEGSINRELESEPQNPAGLDCDELERGAEKPFEMVWRCEGTRFGTKPVSSRVLVDAEGCWQIAGGFAGEYSRRDGCINLWDAIGSPLS